MQEQNKRKFVTLYDDVEEKGTVKTVHRHKPSLRNYRAIDIITIGKGKFVPDTDNKIKVYVSGQKFYVEVRNLMKYPDTLLGSFDRESHFSRQLGCYFFDRNRKAFKAILEWYRTGNLECPKSLEVWEFERELQFFRINARNGTMANPPQIHRIRPNKNWPEWQQKIYYVVAEPSDDIRSRVWAVMDTLFILCSIVLFIAETEPFFRDQLEDTNSTWYNIFFWGDSMCVTFFLFDFIIRMFVWPNKADFFKSLLNWLDFLAILPFFVMITTNYVAPADDAQADQSADKGTIVALKVLRLMRVIRLLKLAKHSEQLVLIISVVKRSGNEMSIMALLWVISTVTFGSVMYYAENEHPESQMTSISSSCWWTIATMSTVGYGDKTPKTNLGRLLASCVVFLSMVFMALPMTLIVGKFSAAYDSMQSAEEEKGEEKKEEGALKGINETTFVENGRKDVKLNGPNGVANKENHISYT